MNEKSLSNVIVLEVSKKKKYFLVVAESECVLECWANSYTDLAGIITIYDEEEKPHTVNMIVDVGGRHIYEIKRDN